MLCNPQNPGGMVFTREELTELANICIENNIMIISDEIHSDLIFEGNKHIPIASLSDEIAQNCMVSMAPSKTFNVAGFSSSIVIIPNKTKFARYERAIGVGHLHMGNIFGTVAMEAAYTHGDEWLDQLIAYLSENYRILEDFFKIKLPKVKVMKPEATYLIWLDFREYGMKNDALMKFTLENAKVGLRGWLAANKYWLSKKCFGRSVEKVGKSVWVILKFSEGFSEGFTMSEALITG